jgi:hypothetical protein
VFCGLVKDEMRKFAWSQKCKWSIQDGQLTMIPLASYIPTPAVPIVSPNTGLIGVPEQAQDGIRMRTLLNAGYKIGQCVKLESAAINQYRYGLDTESAKINQNIAGQNKINSDGLYYVMVANHVGDTRGEDWYTDMICLAVDATFITTEAANTLTAVGPVPGPIQP